MEQPQIDDCCDIGVKGTCLTCDYIVFCSGKWSHPTTNVEKPVR